MTEQAIMTPTAAALQTVDFRGNLIRRQRRAKLFARLFFAANISALTFLFLIFGTVLDRTLGLVVTTYAIEPSTLTIEGRTLEEQSVEDMGQVLLANTRKNRLRVLVRDNVLSADFKSSRLSQETIGQIFAGKTFAPTLAEKKLNDLTEAELVSLLTGNLNRDQLFLLIQRDVAQLSYLSSYGFFSSIFNPGPFYDEAAVKHPGKPIVWKSWFNLQFVTGDLTAQASTTGLRLALIGTVAVILLTVVFALPIGVGAAVYLEEYAPKNRFSSLIETNIRNLAGVPSIIYGMLGLSVFVRFMEPITSGSVFGLTDTNGRTILAAALTMTLLILPVIIINSQEAVRAVAPSLREASYGVGATKWQTVWRVVLPSAVPGILTGLILSMSRALGETAPLLVVGGLTFSTVDPNSIFSNFSVLPIQIYSWTAQPDPLFRNVAAAAIVTLLFFLLSLNATAIILRQRASRKLRG
jgi:phosphate transport system permease protein